MVMLALAWIIALIQKQIQKLALYFKYIFFFVCKNVVKCKQKILKYIIMHFYSE